MSLLFSGTFVRCRDIRFVFCHAGGTLPALTGRVEWGTVRMGDFAAQAPDGYRAELARLHFDTATSTNAIALGALRSVVPISQIMFGSDFPYGRIGPTLDGLDDCGLTAEERAAIEYGNAQRLVPRFKGD